MVHARGYFKEFHLKAETLNLQRQETKIVLQENLYFQKAKIQKTGTARLYRELSNNVLSHSIFN